MPARLFIMGVKNADSYARVFSDKAIHNEDEMIAATARIHGLTVVTRNVADFRGFGVGLLNPFEPF